MKMKKEKDSSIDNKNNDDEDAENLNSRTTQLFTGIEENTNIGPKQQKGFIDIRNTLDGYVNNFNKSFYVDVFVKFCKQVKKLVDEKFNKYIENNSHVPGADKRNQSAVNRN